ncbi:hypothetical protein SDC9_90734 [bioreactor metagenome]|uniref:Uncharacterized protein n=1 Tax=bioreactor metagenome TaxID=1076179 RepID=A0A644ZTI3_9ZZZZ
MDATSVCQVIALLLVEGFQVGDVLEEVCIQLSALQSFIGGHIIGELPYLEGVPFLSQILNHETEESGMGFGGCSNKNGLGVGFFLGASCEQGCSDQQYYEKAYNLFHTLLLLSPVGERYVLR